MTQDKQHAPECNNNRCYCFQDKEVEKIFTNMVEDSTLWRNGYNSPEEAVKTLDPYKQDLETHYRKKFASCNVEDDQPNDAHINFFNIGHEMGRKKFAAELLEKMPEKEKLDKDDPHLSARMGYNQALAEIKKLIKEMGNDE